MFRKPGAPARRQPGRAPSPSGLIAAPTSLYSWDFDIQDGTRAVTRLDMANWRDEAAFQIEGEDYRARRMSRRGPYVLECKEGELARALKPSMFRRTFTLSIKGTPYELRPSRMLGRRFGLYQGSREVGWVGPERAFRRRLRAEFPTTFDDMERMFVLFLVITTWRNDARAAAAGA